jgi:hypothetical protein
MTASADVFGRDTEWAESSDLSASPRENALMSVYGRRRQGKSLLLQALAQESGGLYWEAALQSRDQNLASFSTAWSQWTGASGPVRFANWEEALDTVFRAPPPRGKTRLALLLDEIGYAVDTAPELPSLLQRHFGPRAEQEGFVSMVLCGSVFAQMTKLFAAGRPCGSPAAQSSRGAAYIPSARVLGLSDNPDAAFRLHALIGGTPAYKRFRAARSRSGDVDRWTIRHLLEPSSPLFFEGSLLIAEDPTLVDKALYWSVLGAVADGHRRRGDIAKAIGRPATALAQPLTVLAEGSWIEIRADPLHKNASTVFNRADVCNSSRLDCSPTERVSIEAIRRPSGRCSAASGAHRIRPHLEWLAAEWVRHAHPESVGGSVRSAGPSILRAGGRRYQVDLVGIEPDRNGMIACVVGETKAERTPMGLRELARLDEIVDFRPRAKRKVRRPRGPDRIYERPSARRATR